VEIHFRYDEELARRAARHVLARNSRLFVSFLIALLVTIFATLQRVWWIVSPFAVLTFLYVAMAVRQRSSAIRAFRRIGNPDVTLRVDDKEIMFEMPSYRATAEWTSQREIWRFDDIWIFMLFGTVSSYTPVPTSVMTDEFRDTVLDAMRAHGGRVR